MFGVFLTHFGRFLGGKHVENYPSATPIKEVAVKQFVLLAMSTHDFDMPFKKCKDAIKTCFIAFVKAFHAFCSIPVVQCKT